MGFWIVAGAMSALAALVIFAAVHRPRSSVTPTAAFDLQVYKDQLSEIDRDLERGVLNEDDAARARTEVSRRILEADRALQRDQAIVQTSPKTALAIGVGLVATVGLALLVYAQLGAPGYRDLPIAERIERIEQARAERPSQEMAEAQVPPMPRLQVSEDLEQMVAQLRTILERRPDDTDGLRLLAQNEARLGNFRAARLAQTRLISLLAEQVTALEYIDLAEMMILGAGGYVSPEAEAQLRIGLEMEPRNGTGRYYAGLMYAQSGRPDLAFPIWRDLLNESSNEAPWLEPIMLQIEEVAYLAGTQDQLENLPQPQPPAQAPAQTQPPSDEPLRGPSADQIEAAGEMSAQDRGAMIQNMVAGLAERLANEGGAPEEWAQLISALIVLGREEDARAIYEDATQTFADAPAGVIAVIEDAAAPLLEAGQ